MYCRKQAMKKDKQIQGVTRYDCDYNCEMITDPEGAFVLYDDYEKVKEQIERLKLDIKRHKQCKWQDGFDEGYSYAIQEAKHDTGCY